MGKIQAYVIYDNNIESLVDSDDVDGFREYAEDGCGIDFTKFEFNSEEELDSFLSGFFHGCDERSPAGKVVLRDNNDYDKPFIKVLETQ